MKTLLSPTLALTVLLALVVAGESSQLSKSGATPQSARERKPVAQEVVLPIQGGETSVQEDRAVGPQPIEAPAPGVPEGRRTYREIKERAKGGP